MRRKFTITGKLASPMTLTIPGAYVRHRLSKELIKLDARDALYGAFIGDGRGFRRKSRLMQRNVVCGATFGPLRIIGGKFSIEISSDYVSDDFWREIIEDIADGKFTFTVCAA